jgi:hypothetical protein
VCFTERPVLGVECRELPSDFPTWWSKVGLFKPGVFTGDVLYLDLDVVITDRLDGLVSLLEQDRTKVWALDDFGYPLSKPRHGIGGDMKRLLGGIGTVNSSVMLWNGDTGRKVWDDFKPEKMDEVHGDQNWITQALWPHTLRLIPEGWAKSYKYNLSRGDPGIAPIMVFHGEPKPHQVYESWVAEHWL